MLVYFLPAGLSDGKYDIDAEENRARLGSAEEENEADRAGGGCVRFFDNFRRGYSYTLATSIWWTRLFWRHLFR